MSIFTKKAFSPSRRSAYAIKRETGKWTWAIVRAIFIIGFSFVILHPLINMLTRAFMEPQDLYDSSVLWVPQNFTFANFDIAINGLQYGKAFFNSLWSAGLATLLQVASCTFAGYALARYNFPCRNIAFGLVIFTLIVPPQLTMISSYIYFNDLKLVGTELPIMIMAATGNGIRAGLFIFIVRQSFKSFPREIEEAAMVDGAGHFRTFFSIMLPAAVTVLVTVVLFSFVWYWNDVFYVNLYNRNFWSLSNCIDMAKYSFANYPEFQGFSEFDPVISKNLRSVAAILIIGPLVLLFIVLQRYFVESVERSGIVG